MMASWFCLLLCAEVAWAALTAPGDVEVTGSTTFFKEVSGPYATFQSLVANISAGSRVGTPAGDGFHVSAATGNDTTGDGSHAFPYYSIERAIAAITALPSSVTRPVYLAVHAGIYTVDNNAGPVALPLFMVIAAEHRYAAVIRFTNNSNAGFSLGTDCMFQGFILQGPTQAAALYDAGMSNYGIYEINFSRGKYLLEANGGAGEARYVRDVTMTSTAQGLLYAHHGATVSVHDIDSRSTAILFEGVGNGTAIHASNIFLDDVGLTATGIYGHMGAELEISNMIMKNGAAGFILDDADTQLRAQTVTLHNGVVSHVQQLHAGSILNIDGGALHQDRISFITGGIGNVHIHYVDTKPGDRGGKRVGSLSIGVPESGSGTVLGEGKSYTRGMLVYKYNATGGTWTDVSTNLAAGTHGATDVFPSTDVDSAMYFASTLQKDGANVRISGVKLAMATAWVPGAGSIVWEYYNGTWALLPIMAVKDDGTYLPLATAAFESLVDVEVRFNDVAMQIMSPVDPMVLGTAYRWVRVRISTALTGTPPQISQVKLYANAAEMNKDGYLTFYGTARPRRTLPITYIGWRSANNPSPSKSAVFLGIRGLDYNYGMGRAENFYDVDSAMTGFTFVVPPEIDTSCAIRMTVYYILTDTGVGSGEMTIHTALSKNGDVVRNDLSTPTPANMRISSVPLSWGAGSHELQRSFTVSIDVSDMLAVRSTGVKDVLWMWIRRETMTGDLSLIDVSVEYVSWALGGHGI